MTDYAETITVADYADDLALQANELAQAESPLHSLEQAAGGIGLYVNTNETEFMHFKQEGRISILRGKPMKLVDQFKYLGNNISSAESDVNMSISKSDLSEKLKQDFFQAAFVSVLLYKYTTLILLKRIEM